MRLSSAFFFFSSRRRHTRYWRDWSSDVCSSDLEQAGVLAARLGVDGKHPLQPRAEVRHARIGVAHRARGADGRATAAAHAQVRIDLDVVAVRRDGAGRADIQALVAADLRGAAVRADLLVIGEEARLFELAHPLAELPGRQRLLERIGARREVVLRRLRGAYQRLCRDIEHHVEALASLALGALEVDRADRAAGLDALAVRLALVHVDLVGKIDRLLRARMDAGVAARADFQVDRVVLLPDDLELAQMAFYRLYFSRPNRIAAFGRQFPSAAARDQHIYFELLGELIGPGHRGLGRADDEQLTARLVAHARHRFGFGQLGEREQRSDLGRRRCALLRPARVFADIDELQLRRSIRRLGDFREQRRLLRAGDHAGFVLERLLEAADVLAAQLRVHLDRLREFERGAERLGIERHGLVAVADFQRAVLER